MSTAILPARSTRRVVAERRLALSTAQVVLAGRPDRPGVAAPTWNRPDERPNKAWQALIDRLVAIRGYVDDWDGEGSEAPSPVLVDGAIRLAVWLRDRGWPPADRVAASVNATVHFEWHADGVFTDIEVVAPDEAEQHRVDTETNSVTPWRLRF